MSNGSSFRPLRNALENTTTKIPEGPLGFVGGGSGIGFVGFIGTEITKAFVPGSELDPGFEVLNHQIKRSGQTERHKFEINAYNQNIARMAARVRAAPSNVDFITQRTEIINVNEKRSRTTASTWSITVQVRDRNISPGSDNSDDKPAEFN